MCLARVIFQALDTIVEKVNGAEGEDIAVLLLGYEEQMMRMLRNQNPGLMRRFNTENAFRFPDYNDTTLRRILKNKIKKDGLKSTLAVEKAAVAILAKQRYAFVSSRPAKRRRRRKG